MARDFIDGFESGGDDLWDTKVGTEISIISSAGLNLDGDYCLQALGNTDYLQRSITSASEKYFALLYRVEEYRAGGLLSVWNDSTLLVHIWRTQNTGILNASLSNVLLEDDIIVLAENTTYLIEIYIKIANSGGRVVVKVDNITKIDYTGDTLLDTNSQFNKVRLGTQSGAIMAKAWFDNFIMDDAAWIGSTKIQAVVPTGVGNSTGWTPSVGVNWECVDEKPVSDVDYVSINAVDTTDTYATGNMAGTIDSVKCVQVQSRVETEGSPTPTNLKLAVRSGGADYFSGDNVVPASPKSFSYLWENNPADSLAWEEADVNAMEIGVKSAA